MNLKSNYNAPKYGGSAIATPAPDSTQTEIKRQVERFNRIVSSPQPGLMLVEPLPIHTDLSLEAIARRYHMATGFKLDAFSLTRNGSQYVASINMSKLGTITGNGKLVGQGGIVAGKMKVSDSFSIMQLENAEYLTV